MIWARGFDVVVPSLATVTTAPPPRCQAAARAVGDSISGREGALVLVGHSGAGLLLPLIGGTISTEPSAYLFVDSGLPPLSGKAELAPASFKRFLRGLAADDRLPRWSEWWPSEVMDRMLPPGELREHFEAELPRLPLEYFDEQPEVPHGWSLAPAGYLQLSPAYEQDAAAAEARGWPVERLQGSHLDIVVQPRVVVERLLLLLAQLGLAASSPTAETQQG